jgi:uncharacterized protein (UPF0276 family)
MIRLGVTDCPKLRALIDGGEYIPDYLEVHGPFVEEARRAYPTIPMVLHNTFYQWSLTHHDGLEHMDAARLTLQRLENTKSPWYSLHLGFSAEDIEFNGSVNRALSETLPPEVIYERACIVLNQLKQLVMLPVLVENLDYIPESAYETICQPQFISRVLAETNINLLLDISHARISAAALNMPARAYLEQLPLELVREVHVNRPTWRGRQMWDAHEAMQEEYELLSWVLDRCQPWAVTLEYNINEHLLLEQVKRLRALLAITG